MINSNRVTEIFMDCLFKEHEEMTYEKILAMKDEDKPPMGKGIRITCYFNKERINNYKEEIKNMIKRLPTGFDSPYGDCFEAMVFDVDEDFWTGFHKIAEQLLCLGNALGYLEFVDTGIEGKMKNIKRTI